MRNTRVIFLDIDGVMNSLGTRPEDRRGLCSWLDPANVAVLNTIVRATNAVIVVSSTWRVSMPLPELRAAFREAGIEGSIIDVTPNIDGSDRQREIVAWLTAQPVPPAHYVIIDDYFPMPDLPERLVKTSRLAGLTVRELPAVLAILAG